MLFSFDIAIPANTAKNSPLITPIKLPVGRIHRVEIDYPPGPRRLAHIVIRRGLNQVWPTNPEGDLKSDNWVIGWNDDEPVERGDNWYIDGWNDDTRWPHTIIVRIAILGPTKEEQIPATETILERLKRLFT